MVVATGDVRLPRLRRRDAQSELDRLYRRHGAEVLRYARLVLRSAADADDVVQITFLRALRALERGERVEKPRNWLIKIAHNECRRVLQARQRRHVEVELEDIPVEQNEPGRADELRRALEQLAPNQREALVLRELEGRSYAEIAVALQLSESAVETLIFRARRALREQLETGVGCDEAATLLQAEVLSLDERRKLRAHTRACADCAALERRARGRKSALRRIASSLGLPWWGAKAAVVVLGAGVAASGVGIAVAVAEPHAHGFPLSNATPAHVTFALATTPHPVAVREAPVARPVQPVRRRRRTTTAHHRVTATPVRRVPSTVRVSGRVSAAAVETDPATTSSAPAAPAAAAPAPAERSAAPTAPPAPSPAPAPHQPSVTTPTVTVPAATVTTPIATVSTPALTTPVVTVTVPAVPAPPVTVTTPQIPHLGP